MCPSLQSSRSLVSTLIGRLFSGNENFIRIKCFKVLMHYGKFVMILSASWISNDRSKIRIFVLSFPDKLLSSSCIPFILSFRLSSWLWIAMAGFPRLPGRELLLQSFNRLFGALRIHTYYCWNSYAIDIAVVLVLSNCKRFSIEKAQMFRSKAFDRSFLSKTKSVFLVMLLSKRIQKEFLWTCTL